MFMKISIWANFVGKLGLLKLPRLFRWAAKFENHIFTWYLPPGPHFLSTSFVIERVLRFIQSSWKDGFTSLAIMKNTNAGVGRRLLQHLVRRGCNLPVPGQLFKAAHKVFMILKLKVDKRRPVLFHLSFMLIFENISLRSRSQKH